MDVADTVNFTMKIHHLIPLAVFAAALQAAAPAAGKKLVFVGQTKAAAETVAADAAAQARLAQLGFAVTFVDQHEPAPALAGVDLVVVSAGVSAHVVEGRFRHATVPVVLWEAYLLPHMGMTGRKEGADYGTHEEKQRYLWMVNAPHPLSAGRAAGLLNVVKRGGPMNWGRPGPGAIIIATMPGELAKGLIFAYEKGATMDGENLAPARRVMLFLDNNTFPGLNDDGQALFDAAVLWAAGLKS